MVINKETVRATIRYHQDILSPNQGGTSTKTVGDAIMECEIEIALDWYEIRYGMGRRACQSKTGKCQDGPVVVKRLGKPKEVSREMNQWA